MGVSLTYKVFVILFSIVFFAFIQVISRRKKQVGENYFYKEGQINGGISPLSFSYEEQYDTTDQQLLKKRFSSLLSTQLYYTKTAMEKSEHPMVQ